MHLSDIEAAGKNDLERKGSMNKIIASAFSIFIYFTASVSFSQEVRSCEIVFLEDSSAFPQRRWKAFVFSDAGTVEDRLATAVFVAREILDRTNYHFIDVFLTPEEAPRERSKLHSGTAVAWVRYATDPAKIPFMDNQIEAEATDAEYSDHLVWEKRQVATDKAMQMLDVHDPDITCDLTLP